ncbi:hypothetical protein V474_07650 [Novosphingobium barchaimii LL02]|uniref:Uncharacterized protein n=1 Tax=Novosphingobium barchaimii LL02 TaxID=1114963 RepID=A0A0J7Y9G6_9SPHN|nr:hypothetical protein V474_07650 [Novosphingobium barchaimii LL02]
MEIPAACIIAVMKPCDGANPCSIIFDAGAGPLVDQLSDQYGFVKKAAVDGMAMVNAIELRIVEPVPPADGEAAPVMAEGKLFCARSRITGRREVIDDPAGIRAKLFVDLFGKPMTINVADTLDEMDGVDPAPVAIPSTTEGA